ncbi:MAG: hypothetical protein ABSA21_12955 [Candidatus Limnocylindrales bacterium]|jgi:hypothetical protein
MTDASIVRTFRGNRQSIVEADAASDAELMAREGYVVTSRIWSNEHAGFLQRLLAVGPARADLLRGDSSLTVTYERTSWTPDDQPA